MEAGLIKLNPQLLSILSSKQNGGTDLVPFQREIFVINVFVAGTGYCDNIEDIQEHITPDTRLMDAGKMFNCKVVSIDRRDPSWPRINVSIYMLD